jgi:hypothetical protein
MPHQSFYDLTAEKENVSAPLPLVNSNKNDTANSNTSQQCLRHLLHLIDLSMIFLRKRNHLKDHEADDSLSKSSSEVKKLK